MSIQSFFPAVVAAVFLTAGNALSAPVVLVDENPDLAPGISLPVSAHDLVDEVSPVLLSEIWSGHSYFNGSSPDVLNDGSPGGLPDGGWNLNANEGAVTTQKTPWTLTYMLDTANAPYGFEITQIEAMSLWLDDYVNQHYSVYISTVGNAAFTPLILDVIAIEQELGPGDNASSLKTIILDPSGVLASNVDGIYFEFMTQPQTYSPGSGDTIAAYKEIDVFGYVSVPEPAAGLLALVVCGLLPARRRKA